MFWRYCPEKAKARKFVLPSLPVTNGIWLPAGEALCVKAAYEAGLLSSAKNLFFVEGKGEEYEKMLETTSHLKNRRPFCGDLANLKLNCKIDYAFLDYLGGINTPIGHWMANELSVNIKEGAQICITHMLACRKNKLLLGQDAILRSPAGSFIRSNYGVLSLALQRILLLVHRVFREWDFEIVPDNDGKIYKYSDSVITMLVLKLVNFRPSPHSSLFPKLEKLP
jgi:hypothetical protein